MIVKNNLITEGLSGRFGDFIFKVLRGKTIVAKRAKKSTSFSERQQGTRTKFKEASAFAKAAMLDADRKAYYQKKAIKLKLPNAYTAALTDFMRKPQLREYHIKDTPILDVVKKDFEIKKVVFKTNNSVEREIIKEQKTRNSIAIKLTWEEISHPITVIIEDETGQRHEERYTFTNQLHEA